MKKIFAILLVLMLVCATPLVASAEDYEIGDVYEGVVEEDNSAPETETPTEGEISPPEETPETVPTETPEEEDPTLEDEVKTITGNIVKWLEEHSGEIGVIVTLIGYGIVLFSKLGTVIKSAGTLNNNAITVAENSSSAISKALSNMEGVTEAVTGYQTEIAMLLAEYRKTAEEKKTLEATLTEFNNYLKTAKLANVELANEVAELLVLANIPNSKKEELYSRHRAAVDAIANAEHTEVKEDDGKET